MKSERFQIESSGENPATINVPPGELPPPIPATQGIADPTFIRLTLPRLAEIPVASGEPAPPVVLPPVFRPLPASFSPPENQLNFPYRTVLVPLICLALGALGGTLLSRPAKPAAGTAPPSTLQEEVNPLTPAEQAELDAAYMARHMHQFAEAEQRFTNLRQNHPNWAAMEAEVGRTLLYEGNLGGAETSLEAVTKRGSLSADTPYLLGVVNLRNKNYSLAEANFAKAVARDPSRPEYYYFWGQCLREEGKPLEAATKFRAALLCNQYETAESFYRVKLWLSEIEADQENTNGLGTEIDAALARPRPPMEALVAAAARDLKTNDFRTAAGHLRRARQRADPEVFPSILSDPLFALVQSRPEFADLFHSLAQWRAAISMKVQSRPEFADLFHAASPAAEPASGRATGSPVNPTAGSGPEPMFPTPTFALPAKSK